MKSIFIVMVVLLLAPAWTPVSAELLTAEEQSFETGATPGRWVQFAWPCVWSNCTGTPSGTSCNSVKSTSLSWKCTEGPDGQPIQLLNIGTDAAPGFGSKCIGIRTPSGSTPATASTGGIRITVGVVPGTTYLVSGWVKFATDAPSGYGTGVGMSFDNDGGIDPGAADYGVASNAVPLRQPFHPQAAPSEWGDCVWSRTMPPEDPVSNNQLVWWGPAQFKQTTVATGTQLTVFLWGLSKFGDNMAMLDGISIEEVVVPPAANERWRLYN